MYEGTLDGSRVYIERVRVYVQGGPQEATKVRPRCRPYPCPPSLTKLTDVLPRGRSVETLDTPPHILPLLGTIINPSQLVSNWMSGGDLPGYIKETPEAGRLRLVGIRPVMFFPRLLPSPVIRR